MRAVGAAAALLAPRDGDDAPLQVALRRCLFPLLERLGDRSELLASGAELTLCRFCAACRHPPVRGVRELLAFNGDFLLDALSRRLRAPSCDEHTAQVLQAVLEYAGPQTLPLMRDVVDDFMALLDDASAAAPRPALLLACLRALHALVLAAADATTPPAPGDAADDPFAPADADAERPARAHFGDLVGRLVGDGGALGGGGSDSDDDDSLDEAAAAAKARKAAAKAAAEAEEEDEEAAEERRMAADAKLREDDAEQERRRTPPYAPALALRAVTKAEVLLLTSAGVGGAPALPARRARRRAPRARAVAARAPPRAVQALAAALRPLLGGRALGRRARDAAARGGGAPARPRDLGAHPPRGAPRPPPRPRPPRRAAAAAAGRGRRRRRRAAAAAASAAASRHARHARTRAHEVLLAALDALDALCAVREVARAEVMRVARASAPRSRAASPTPSRRRRSPSTGGSPRSTPTRSGSCGRPSAAPPSRARRRWCGPSCGRWRTLRRTPRSRSKGWPRWTGRRPPRYCS